MRMVSVREIFRRARKRADMASSGFYTDDDMFDLLNTVYTNLYDLIVDAFQNYFVKDPAYTFTTVPGTNSYDLPDDFYKMILVEEKIGPNQYSTIFGFNELDRNSVLSTDTSVTTAMEIRMRYIPVAPTFDDLDDEFDGFNGWDDLVVLDMAIAMLESEESDVSSLERRRAQLLQRLIVSTQNRDVTLPARVTDVSQNSIGTTPDLLRYRFYGNKIEFINVTYLGV